MFEIRIANNNLKADRSKSIYKREKRGFYWLIVEKRGEMIRTFFLIQGFILNF